MRTSLQMRTNPALHDAGGLSALWLGLLLAAGAAAPVFGQGQIASGTIAGSGSGPSTYSLTFSDAAGASSAIGSVWYAWIPGSFYLPGTPTSASAPAGWTASIVANSIQFSANSVANDILPGNSLSGFDYVASFSPTQLGAAPDAGVSVAYSGGIESGPGDTFTVRNVPEPAVMSLPIPAAGLCWFARRRVR